MSKLPKSWREIKSAEGEVLYWRRDHSGYEVHPYGYRFEAWLGGKAISGETYPTRDHAILACREHLHRSQHPSMPVCNSVAPLQKSSDPDPNSVTGSETSSVIGSGESQQ